MTHVSVLLPNLQDQFFVMPEFKVFIRIHVPYDKVWEQVSLVGNIEKWCPVKFTGVTTDETVKNGLNLAATQRFFGYFNKKDMFVRDAYTESRVRRQYSFTDKHDPLKMNRVTYMFDDNSISTMIALTEDPDSRRVLEEQAKTEPPYQIDVMAHVFYSMGSSFWRSIAEMLFVNPFFKLIFEKRVRRSLQKLKEMCEQRG
jgi:hypothetical protein